MSRSGSLSAAELFRQIKEAGLPDLARRSGGSMKSLRTIPNYDEAGLDSLAHAAMQALEGRGYFFEGPTQLRAVGRQPVKQRVPIRDANLHRKIFRRMTGGEPSASRYMAREGLAADDVKYEILHAKGVGEVGDAAQVAENLGAASEGANTEMIPFDKAISGNPDIRVASYFEMRPGTQRAERIHQVFFHKEDPSDPIFHRVIDGDRPKPTRDEYEALEADAARFKDPDVVRGAVRLRGLKRKRGRVEQEEAEYANGQGAADAEDAALAKRARVARRAPSASDPMDVESAGDAMAGDSAASAADATGVLGELMVAVEDAGSFAEVLAPELLEAAPLVALL